MPTINLGKKKDVRVPTTSKKEYQEIYQDKRWRKLRKIKLMNNPLCERCERKGLITPTEEVHHIKPFEQGKTKEEIELLAFDYDNLESCCEPCHEQAHKELKNEP